MAGASQAVTEALSTYFFIRIWAAPFTLANYVILGSTLGRGRTDLGLLLQVAINVANIALTMTLVLGFGFGVAGAAIGTALAEVLGVGPRHRWCCAASARTRSPSPGGEVLDRAAMLQNLADEPRHHDPQRGADRSPSRSSARMGARAGDVTLAANAVLYNMFLIGGYFLDGFATAAETLCGQSIGARDERSFRRAVQLEPGLEPRLRARRLGALPDRRRLLHRLRVDERGCARLCAAISGLRRADAARRRRRLRLRRHLYRRDLDRGHAQPHGDRLRRCTRAVLLRPAASATRRCGSRFLLFLGARGLGQALLYPRLTQEDLRRV